MRKSEEIKQLILENTKYGLTYKIAGILDDWAEEIIEETIKQSCTESSWEEKKEYVRKVMWNI